MSAILRWADGGPVYSGPDLRWADGGPGGYLEVRGGAEAALFSGAVSGQCSVSALMATSIRMESSTQGYGAFTGVLTNAINLIGTAAGHATVDGAIATPGEILAVISRLNISTKSGQIIIGTKSGRITIN